MLRLIDSLYDATNIQDLEEKVGDRTSLMGNESMTSQPDRHSPPPSPQGASPAISQAPGTRGASLGQSLPDVEVLSLSALSPRVFCDWAHS